MFVSSENERDIQFIAIYYYSVLVLMFIYYTTYIFLTERDKIERQWDLKKSFPVLKDGLGKGIKSILLKSVPQH